MVTGVEAAGLALAIFPLVVGGIQSYAEGARTIKEMWRSEMVLSSLSRELEIERCKFENTCIVLLGDSVSDSDLALLMASPGGPAWNANDLQQKLKSRLRPATVECCMKAMEELASTLQGLQHEFKLDKTNKPEPSDRKILKKKLKRIWLVVSKAKYKELLAELTKINADLITLTGQSKLTNSPPQAIASAKHYQRIRKHAIDLYGVLKEKLQVTPACACTAPHNANLRLEVRSIGASQEDFSRDANLRFHVVLSFEENIVVKEPLPWNWREMGLEPLDNEREPSEDERTGDIGSSSHTDGKGDDFRVVHHAPENTGVDSSVSTPTTGNASRLRVFFGGRSESSRAASPTHETTEPLAEKSFNFSLRHLERKNRPVKASRNVSFSLPQSSNTDSASITPNAINAEQIENLCLAIQQEKSDLSCFGVLIDGSNRRYRVWPPKIASPISRPTRVLSLDSLLARPGALTKTDRLFLGVQLASTVMQLHATEWLSGNWSKRDIYFHQTAVQEGGKGTNNYSSLIRKPFVRRTFASQVSYSITPQTIQEPTKSIFPLDNQSLFSLGVILVELWFGQRLEDLRIEADEGIGEMVDYMTAWRQIDKIADDAGARYGDAVRRCIKGLDHRNANLETDDFKNAVHTGVVSPLVENLKEHCGTSLGELLEK